MVNSAELLNMFKENNVRYHLYEHAPLKKAEDADFIRHKVKGVICKTLFLTDDNEAYWLVTVPLEVRVDLKKLAQQLGSGRLSFGDEQAMRIFLGVLPGSVTPLAVINDTENKVGLVLEQSIMQHDMVNVHPLINTLSVDLSPRQIVMFAEDFGHDPLFVKDICV